MTEAEKELRRLAQSAKEAASYGGDEVRWHRFRDAAQPAAVLALLDRIEALETELDVTKRDLDAAREASIKNSEAYFKALDRIEALEKQVGEAERNGAEEMRAAAVDGCREWSIPMPIDVWQGTKKELSAATARALADRIQSLPLPGDAP